MRRDARPFFVLLFCCGVLPFGDAVAAAAVAAALRVAWVAVVALRTSLIAVAAAFAAVPLIRVFSRKVPLCNIQVVAKGLLRFSSSLFLRK